MNHVICTGDYVWVQAGHTSRHGTVQAISVNYLSQIVYWIDGQPYSDPEISRSLKKGDTVILKEEGDRAKWYPKIGRVLDLTQLYGGELGSNLAIFLEVWEGAWIPHSPVLSCDVVKTDFRLNVPPERALATCGRVSP